GYHVDNTVLSISKANKEGEKLYSELQSALELYDKESLQSKIAEETSKWGLYESIDPPVIINSNVEDEE
ncbi:MAG: FtsL-like putative cell division protein, partial [Bacteroidota bacterium]|nr:FtsL-like putative cell division protein [Bacteroidota bacterium]